MERLTTQDMISDHVRVLQHARGYRFGLDALLLATDLPCSPARVCELGAAHGPVALCIAARLPQAEVLAVELQPSLLSLLERNIALNEPSSARVRALGADVRQRQQLPPHWASLVVCNPPYFPTTKRDPCDDLERAIARHELRATLADFVRAAQYVLQPRGWLKLILPPWRLSDLFDALQGLDLAPLSVRSIHAAPEQDAYLLEIVLRRSARADLRLRSPLLVRDHEGYYTPEVARRVAGAALAAPDDALIARTRERSLASHLRPSHASLSAQEPL